jgi:1-acyl-sn-glycerol-3-phosphate acyltransferase
MPSRAHKSDPPRSDDVPRAASVSRASVPRPAAAPGASIARYLTARLAAAFIVRCYLRVRVEGIECLPDGPAILCFNHQNWADPFVVMAALPWHPRLFFFGPKEEDMARGGRNRIMAWTGASVPYKPAKNDLLGATRRVEAVLSTGARLAIAGEGRIHAGERALLPLSDGAAFFALRAGVPIVPLAINGMSWIRFGRRVRVRVGAPIAAEGRPTREAVDELTARTWTALHELVADFDEPRVPGPIGRAVTEWFNDWPEGRRPRAD